MGQGHERCGYRHGYTALMKNVCFVLLLAGLLVCLSVQAESDGRRSASEKVWRNTLKPGSFSGRSIIMDKAHEVIRIRAPEWVEDPTAVPVSVHAVRPQTDEFSIRRMWLFIDRNPLPLVGVFELAPRSGRADLALKVRVDDASFVRVVAETSDGELYMDKTFMHSAGGGCSVPPGPGAQVSMDRRGEMKLKFLDEVVPDTPVLTQLMIRHPNITGLSIDVETRNRPPAYFLDELVIDHAGKKVLKARLTFALSRDPVLRFYFRPQGPGALTVKAGDTQQQQYVDRFPVPL